MYVHKILKGGALQLLRMLWYVTHIWICLSTFVVCKYRAVKRARHWRQGRTSLAKTNAPTCSNPGHLGTVETPCNNAIWMETSYLGPVGKINQCNGIHCDSAPAPAAWPWPPKRMGVERSAILPTMRTPCPPCALTEAFPARFPQRTTVTAESGCW